MNRPSAVQFAMCGLVTLAVAIGIGRFAFTPILPMMQRDSGMTLRMAGLLASANYIGYFAGALCAIWIRVSTATVVRFSLVTVTVLTAAMGWVHEPYAWLVLRGLAGLASAWTLIFASAYILEQLAAQNRKPLGGVVFGGVGSGIALSGALCLLFLNLSWSADEAWIATGLIGLGLVVICWPAYAGATATRAVRRSGDAPLRLGDHWIAITCYGIFGFAYIIPATFLPAMAKQAVPDPAVFGWTWPVFGAAALVSTLAAGRLSSRLSNRAIWAGSHVVMAFGLVVPALLPGMAGIFVSACCVGGTFMVATMAGIQEARILAPDHAPRLMAAMTAAFGIGQILGPLLVSSLAGTQNGINLLLLASAAVLFASALVIASGTRRPTMH